MAEVGSIIKAFPGGYNIRVAPACYNAAEQKTYNNFELVNPQGKVLCHADEVSDLEMIVDNSEWLKNLEKTGSISS